MLDIRRTYIQGPIRRKSVLRMPFATKGTVQRTLATHAGRTTIVVPQRTEECHSSTHLWGVPPKRFLDAFGSVLWFFGSLGELWNKSWLRHLETIDHIGSHGYIEQTIGMTICGNGCGNG